MLRIIPIPADLLAQKTLLNFVSKKAQTTISDITKTEVEKLTEIVQVVFPEIKKMLLEDGRLIIFEIYGDPHCPSPNSIISYPLKEASGGLKRLINLFGKLLFSQEKVMGITPEELYFHPCLIRDLLAVLSKQSQENDKILLIATWDKYVLNCVNQEDIFVFSERGLIPSISHD